jgi:uncharacterized protein
MTNFVSNNMQEKRIQAELNRIETEETVKILYACESGSRAWGFESKDSDFDVRFFYIRPPTWYLSIQKKRDVIERMLYDGLLDMVGWDLQKTLGLFRKSNPPLYEKLQSPIVYRQTGSFVSRIQELMPDYYSPIGCMYHYLRIAQGNYQKYIRGKSIIGKRCFYILRPVLACIWIERDLGPVPMEFAALVDRVIADPVLREAIDQLLARKKEGKELDLVDQIPVITEFLRSQIDRMSAELERPAITKEFGKLDALFLDLLNESYGVTLTPDSPSETTPGVSNS